MHVADGLMENFEQEVCPAIYNSLTFCLALDIKFIYC